MQDALLGPYELEVGEPNLGLREARKCRKNVVYSKYPILHEKTLYTQPYVPPILEVWIDLDGESLVFLLTIGNRGLVAKKWRRYELEMQRC